MIKTKFDVNRIRTDIITNFNLPYFLVSLSMGLVVVYFFAQNFTLNPIVSIVSVENDFWKSSVFYPFFTFTVLSITSKLTHEKICHIFNCQREGPLFYSKQPDFCLHLPYFRVIRSTISNPPPAIRSPVY